MFIFMFCSKINPIFNKLVSEILNLPVTTNTGSSPRTGVLMYVLVFALRAFILQPEKEKHLLVLVREFIPGHKFKNTEGEWRV